MPAGKTYSGQVTERSYELRIVTNAKPSQVMMNGRALEWSSDNERKMLVVKTVREKVGEMVMEIR